jgi:CRP/FNR family transcriptional regulator, cyclic AMP receptor protein
MGWPFTPMDRLELRMASHGVADVLRESFLGVLPEPIRADLATTARTVKILDGRIVYNPEISIIVDGTLQAFVDDGYGRHLTVSYIRRPQAIGIASAAGRDFPVAFQAVTSCTMLRISRTHFDEIRKLHCEVGWAATKELAHYIDDLLAEIVRVAFHPVRARIAHHLLALTEYDECEHPSVHQAELAAAVGSVREVVGRNVGSLREAHLVEVTHAGVAARNAEGLRSVAELRA